jgi:hypothetical protein
MVPPMFWASHMNAKRVQMLSRIHMPHNPLVGKSFETAQIFDREKAVAF